MEDKLSRGHIGTAKNNNNPPKGGTAVKRINIKSQILTLVDEMIDLYQDNYSARKSFIELKGKIEAL